MMPFDDFRRAAGLIPYQYRHAEFLFSLIRWLRPKSVVEVGTHIGMSAVWMARALQENGAGRLTCIDPFCWVNEQQANQWSENVARCGVAEYAWLLTGRSQEVQWPAQVDFAYIDGNHTYAVCWHDCMKAIELGASCICLNDTATCEGVQKAADQLRHSLGSIEHGGPTWDFLEVPFDAGLLVCLKREPRPAAIHPDSDPWDKGPVRAHGVLDAERLEAVEHNFHDLDIANQ